jgi:acetaldehyde dehydrogenase (acetylating)
MSADDFDRDLRSIHEVRGLTRAARAAQRELETFPQEKIDAIVAAMAAAGLRESERLAEMAVEETGYGRVADKIAKNNFVLENVVAAMEGMRTVGVVREIPEQQVIEIAEPVGVVAGIIPTTNPTSTAMFKCLIALKARCGIVLSPHPNAKACIKAAADVMHEAATAAGAPRGIIGCMTVVSMDGTDELLRGRETNVILATGGMAMVRSAYSAGKPAYGVGPGNVPAYIERSADVEQAVRDIISGTTFDNGTLCSSEQAIVCDRAVADRVRAAITTCGGVILDPEQCERLAGALITEKLLVAPELVGQSAATVAAAAGIDVPADTTVLVCPQDGVGRDHPLSHEKLSPVLALYEVEDWREGCDRCKELLAFGGLGHTMVIHSGDDDVVLEFGLHKPASRVLVNTVASVGAVGLTTNLFPSMTLGCGAWGNNITSDNVGPQHLLNIKRLARGVRGFESTRMAERGGAAPAPRRAAAQKASNDGLEDRIEDFLRSRGIISPAAASEAVGSHASACECDACDHTERKSEGSAATGVARQTTAATSAPEREAEGHSSAEPVDFVAESDVRDAIARGQTIRVGPRTLITPLAKDLGKEHGIFRNA